MKKHPVVTGTLILSGASILSRMIGFLYRIYLSRAFGAQAVGILQMTAPITAMVMAVSCSGIQTALSKRIAEIPDNNRRLKRTYLLVSLFFSVTLSGILAFLVRQFSFEIAGEYLKEPQTEALLSVLALSFPLSAVHSCFCGYWLGQQKAGMPAACQMTEQFARVGTVILLCRAAQANGSVISLRFAVIGSVAGELAAVCICFLYVIFSGAFPLLRANRKADSKARVSDAVRSDSFRQTVFCTRSLLSMAAPLSLNRLTLNFLQSIEAVRIPLSLKLFGYTGADALTVYGVLTGIALPVLFFPGAFIGPFVQMLMPAVSKAHSRREYSRIRTLTVNTAFTLVFLGLFCGLALFLFADFIGTILFQEPLAAGYIRTLCLLCPLLYLNQVLSGILQGLGDAFGVFFINTFSVFTRLCFVFFSVPQIGIRGYFYGLLVSQLSCAVLFLYKCFKQSQNTGKPFAKVG